MLVFQLVFILMFLFCICPSKRTPLRSNCSFSEPGRLMVKFYLKFDTMNLIVKAAACCSWKIYPSTRLFACLVSNTPWFSLLLCWLKWSQCPMLETNSICSNGCRIAKCMWEYFIYKKNYRSAINSMILANTLHQKLWESSPFLRKQLPGIGIVTAKVINFVIVM
jgi:ATP-dependent DNA helicase HFM1/MER3